MALPRGIVRVRNDRRSGKTGTVDNPVKPQRTFREMIPVFAAAFMLAGCGGDRQPDMDAEVFERVFQNCVDSIGPARSVSRYSIEQCRVSATSVAVQAYRNTLTLGTHPASPEPAKERRCLVLDGGSVWDCKGYEMKVIMDHCTVAAPDPGCEDAARAALDQLWIDRETAENDGAKALYEMNKDAVEAREIE